MNVVVVVVDALRTSDIGCFGRSDETTPNIDALAEDSQVFERAYSSSNYTDVCLSSLMSGRPPREHGVTHHGTAHTEANLRRIEERSPQFLPELLHENGYNTLGVDGMGRWHAWGYDEYGVNQAGDPSDGEATEEFPTKILERLKTAATDLPEPLLAPLAKQYYRRYGYNDTRVNCEDLTDIAIDRIDSAEEPFFTFLHYWDVHPPYLPPAEYERRFDYEGADEPLTTYFGRDAKGPMSAEYQPFATGEHRTMAESKEAYDGAVAWVDEQIGRLLDHLRETDRLDETMVVVTADHGHNFGEHGIFSDNCSLYETSIHVPLVIHDPRRGADRIDGLVQHTDLVPTVLDAAGIEAPAGLRGNVLPATREYAFSEAVEGQLLAIATTDWKLIVPGDTDSLEREYWYDAGGRTELYDLDDDPEETRNVATDHPDVVERLQTLLEGELETQKRMATTGPGRSVSIAETDMNDVKSRLNALGYADDDNV
jgi:arylsulfatase A-like enzyme